MSKKTIIKKGEYCDKCHKKIIYPREKPLCQECIIKDFDSKRKQKITISSFF